MKKFILGLMLSLVSLTAQQFYVTNNLAATNNTLLSAAAVLQSIQLYSTNASPTIVQLRDGDATVVTGAYTNWLTYTTNVVSSYINFGTGTTNQQTNTVVTYVANNVAAATNNVNPMFTIVVPASPAVVNYNFRPNSQVINKLTLSNNLAGLNVVLQYRNP